MKVSSATKENAAAVIGYQEATEMTLAATPEFISIFQKSLYKYHTLAMVREVISNAWDAHIDAGITDPIRIQLDKDALVIQDFGKGIPHENMATVYGTIGKGTKANDSKSIGGFGLGCKSPHGYTDSFEVISCNAGTKTIYQIVKASKLTKGKPAIVKVLAVPTTETGLTVKIPIKLESDCVSLRENIKETVRGGEIPAKIKYFNGDYVNIPTLGMGMNEGDFAFMVGNKMSIHLPTTGRLNIRYANIIYEVPTSTSLEDPNYASILIEANKLLERMRNYYDDSVQLIIQAAPDSLAVHPSREAVSSTPENRKVIGELLETFLTNLAKAKTELAPIAAEAYEATLEAAPISLGYEKKLSSHIRFKVGDNIKALFPKEIGETDSTFGWIHKTPIYTYYQFAITAYINPVEIRKGITPENIFKHHLSKGAYCDTALLKEVMPVYTPRLFIGNVVEYGYSKAIECLNEVDPRLTPYLGFFGSHPMNAHIRDARGLLPVSKAKIDYYAVNRNSCNFHTPFGVAFFNKWIVLTDVLSSTGDKLKYRHLHDETDFNIDQGALVIKVPKEAKDREILLQKLIDAGYKVINLCEKTDREKALATQAAVTKPTVKHNFKSIRNSVYYLKTAEEIKEAFPPSDGYISKNVNTALLVKPKELASNTLLLLLDEDHCLARINWIGQCDTLSVDSTTYFKKDMMGVIKVLALYTNSPIAFTRSKRAYASFYSSHVENKAEHSPASNIYKWVADCIDKIAADTKVPKYTLDHYFSYEAVRKIGHECALGVVQDSALSNLSYHKELFTGAMLSSKKMRKLLGITRYQEDSTGLNEYLKALIAISSTFGRLRPSTAHPDLVRIKLHFDKLRCRLVVSEGFSRYLDALRTYEFPHIINIGNNEKDTFDEMPEITKQILILIAQDIRKIYGTQKTAD
ncbi:MAG: ATP-binding protein [Shewanella sp.]